MIIPVRKNKIENKPKFYGPIYNKEQAPIKPIMFDIVYGTYCGAVQVKNIFNFVAEYYKAYNEGRYQDSIIYDKDLEHRRYTLSIIFENRVKNAIMQAYKTAYVKIYSMYKDPNDHRLDYNIIVSNYDINKFINEYIITKYEYIFDIYSYLDGGIFTNSSNIIDCIMAISTDFDLFAARTLSSFDIGRSIYNEEEEDKIKNKLEIFAEEEAILCDARAKLSIEFSKQLAEEFLAILKDLEIYKKAGTTNNELEYL